MTRSRAPSLAAYISEGRAYALLNPASSLPETPEPEPADPAEPEPAEAPADPLADLLEPPTEPQ